MLANGVADWQGLTDTMKHQKKSIKGMKDVGVQLIINLAMDVNRVYGPKLGQIAARNKKKSGQEKC